MLAVGLYDGSVLVFNMQKKTDAPIFQSNAKGGKHTDPVWQVLFIMNIFKFSYEDAPFFRSAGRRMTLTTMPTFFQFLQMAVYLNGHLFKMSWPQL
jgi:hypothetical protein